MVDDGEALFRVVCEQGLEGALSCDFGVMGLGLGVLWVYLAGPSEF